MINSWIASTRLHLTTTAAVFADLGRAVSGSFLATLPLLVLFVFVGRRLVQGIMEGAFKG